MYDSIRQAYFFIHSKNLLLKLIKMFKKIFAALYLVSVKF